MKYLIIICCLLIVPGVLCSASDVSLSFGPWTFITEDENIEGGLYPYAGINFGLSECFEADLFTIVQLTPDIFKNVYLGAGLSSSIMGAREIYYFNLYVDLYFLYGLKLQQTGIVHNRFAGLRLSPLVIGTSTNGFRDKIFSVGAVYNFDSRKFSFTWNLLVMDIFITD